MFLYSCEVFNYLIVLFVIQLMLDKFNYKEKLEKNIYFYLRFPLTIFNGIKFNSYSILVLILPILTFAWLYKIILFQELNFSNSSLFRILNFLNKV